jgi:hypothetical protein
MGKYLIERRFLAAGGIDCRPACDFFPVFSPVAGNFAQVRRLGEAIAAGPASRGAAARDLSRNRRLRGSNGNR